MSAEFWEIVGADLAVVFSLTRALKTTVIFVEVCQMGRRYSRECCPARK